MINNQAYLFTIFTLDGIFIGILFDFFRILRKCFKTKDFVTYFEDTCFWIVTGAQFLYAMCKFCDGELRMFMIIGIVLGITIYIVTISRFIIKISVHIVEIIKKVVIFLLKAIFRPILLIYTKIIKKCNIIIKKMNKNRGFFVKKEKYIIRR